MGNGQYKHQRHKSHPNIASINRKASTSKLELRILPHLIWNIILSFFPFDWALLHSIMRRAGRKSPKSTTELLIALLLKTKPICICIFVLFMTGTTSSLHDKNATLTPRDGMSRTASGSDINEKNYSLFFPIEKLGKVIKNRIAKHISTMRSL